MKKLMSPCIFCTAPTSVGIPFSICDHCRFIIGKYVEHKKKLRKMNKALKEAVQKQRAKK